MGADDDLKPEEIEADESFFRELWVQLQIYFLAAIYIAQEFWANFSGKISPEKLLAETKYKKSLLHLEREKTAIVTGADGTIGREVVSLLIEHGFKVHAIVKSLSTLNEPFQTLLDHHKSSIYCHELDFENPFKVIEFGEAFASQNKMKLDAVICCAGIMLAPETYIEDTEHHMCVNLVSQMAFIDKIGSCFSAKTRILFLGSSCSRAAYLHGQYNIDKLFSRYIGPFQAYAMSKLTLAAYVEQLAKIKDLNIATMHPGVVPGQLYRHLNPVSRLITYHVLPFFLRSPKLAAHLVLHTAFRKDFQSGAYYEDTVAVNIHCERLNLKERETIYSSVNNRIQSWNASMYEIVHH